MATIRVLILMLFCSPAFCQVGKVFDLETQKRLMVEVVEGRTCKQEKHILVGVVDSLHYQLAISDSIIRECHFRELNNETMIGHLKRENVELKTDNEKLGKRVDRLKRGRIKWLAGGFVAGLLAGIFLF